MPPEVTEPAIAMTSRSAFALISMLTGLATVLTRSSWSFSYTLLAVR
jgi:hypothetical protein